MAKKPTSFVKLVVPAGQANPSPPIGPALGQRGLNIMQFVKEFNAQTAGMEQGMPVPVEITGYADRSFSFILKIPPVSYFLRKAVGLPKGTATPGRGKATPIKLSAIREIAEKKMNDLNCDSIDSAISMVKGSARAMGLEVVEG
ncbi:MAG: 50S ribosomal protein L11 [Alphaproteobacteria bacterium]|nr:50S ribosomal protein L11 [Alphaproteobacteria bacterium]